MKNIFKKGQTTSEFSDKTQQEKLDYLEEESIGVVSNLYHDDIYHALDYYDVHQEFSKELLDKMTIICDKIETFTTKEANILEKLRGEKGITKEYLSTNGFELHEMYSLVHNIKMIHICYLEDCQDLGLVPK